MAPRHLPSFLKILQDPSASYLALPPAFVREHMENEISENLILRSVTGERTWSVEIKKIDGIYCFADGWKSVVEDSQLGFWDFLVFSLVDQFTFSLTSFSPNGCEKYFPSTIQTENDDKEQEEEEEAEREEEKEEEDDDDECGEIGGGDGDPIFKMTLSEGHKCCMRVPSEFVRLAGIEAGRSITMKNPSGREWQMSLRSESKVCVRYYLSSVWSDFWLLNNLSEGDECVFKFMKNEDKLLLANITKKHPPGKAPATTEVLKRNRRRPPRVEAAVAVKRPVGRPAKKPAGRAPAAEGVKRPVGRPRKRKRTAGL